MALQPGAADLGVVGDKQGETLRGGHQMLQRGMCNGHAIVGGGSPPQLVDDDQGARGGFRQNGAGLRQLLQDTTAGAGSLAAAACHACNHECVLAACCQAALPCVDGLERAATACSAAALQHMGAGLQVMLLLLEASRA